MTGKERLNRILRRDSGNTASWTTLVDRKTLVEMPENVREMTSLEFYKHIGCDIMQFGCGGIGGTDSPSQLIQADTEQTRTTNPDGTTSIATKSKWGTLNAIWQKGHPVKYPVETIEELRILRKIWENSSYQLRADDRFFVTVRNIVNEIGDYGVMVNTINPSPVQQLLEMDCGMLNFYSLYQDHPEEVRELLVIMHRCRLQEYEILAANSPLDCVIPIENTSTRMISPQLYETLSLPQITDYVNILHKYHKLAVLHMCGHLKNLLPLVKETGCDGINAVTPAPLGDAGFEDVLKVFGDDFVIFGGMFNPFQEHGIGKEKMWSELDHLYVPEIRNANLLLWMGADGQHIPYERFLWVREWFEKRCRLPTDFLASDRSV
jgi:hypothetical protein